MCHTLFRLYRVLNFHGHCDTAETTKLRSSNMGSGLQKNLPGNVGQTTAPCRTLTDHPWRQPSVWDDKLQNHLIIEIIKQQSDSLQNVLILDQTGISSFVMSTIQIFLQFTDSLLIDDADDVPIFRSARYLPGNTAFFSPAEGKYLGEEIKIVDSMLFVKSSVTKNNLFKKLGTISKYSDRYKHRFRTGYQMHCVIFVVSAQGVIDDAKEHNKLKLLRQKLRQTDIPVVLILTKVDMICDEVGKDITKMFRSRKVLEVIKTASKMFEIDKCSIHPVVTYANFFSEMRTEKNIPLLLALRQSFQYVRDYLYSLHVTVDDDEHDDGIRSEKVQLLLAKVEKMLHDDILPENEDIQTINKLCGRQSENMKKLCGRICRVISKVYKDAATDVWPAWDPAKDKIVFVVKLTTKRRSTSLHTDLEIIEYKKNRSALEKEGHMVMVKEMELLTKQTYDIGRLQSLQKKVSTYSKELMDKHKNITAIFPSIVKSVGYFKSGKHRFIESLCISIRVEKKVSGLIPLEEEPIATHLGKFSTDVIEGDFCFLGDRPNDFHENLKIGSAIHAGLVTDKGELLGGTMGCFVKHKTFGLCCLTSAHIILSQAEIQEVLKDGYREYDKNKLKPVYQPISKRLSQFGQVVAAACNEGQNGTPGVEVALIKIQCRQPISGSFPLTDSKTSNPFTFNSGSVADAKLMRPLTEVFKFGIQTGPTFGLLGIPGVSVRYRGGLRLENQLVIMPKKDAPFAENGDSGSSTFVGLSCPGTEAVIGLVSGGFDSGQVLVTPIHAALKAVQCPPYLHRFEDADSGFNDDFSEGSESMDCS